MAHLDALEVEASAALTRLSSTAFSGSKSERNVRTSSTNVTSASTASTYGNALYTAFCQPITVAPTPATPS